MLGVLAGYMTHHMSHQLNVVAQCLWAVNAAIGPLVSPSFGSWYLIDWLLSGGRTVVEVLHHDDQFALLWLQGGVVLLDAL